MKKVFFAQFISFFFIAGLGAQDNLTLVAVGKAEREADKIVFAVGAIDGKLSPDKRKQVNTLLNLFRNNFSFYQKDFKVDKASTYSNQIKKKDWQGLSKNGVRYLALLNIKVDANIIVSATLYDTQKKDGLFSRTYTLFVRKLRETGHQMADDFYQSIKGKASIFKSKIVFVSDKISRGTMALKELYLMDFDGKNLKRLTYHKGTVISPAISPDGTKVLYSLIRDNVKRRNVNLYLLDLLNKKTTLLSSRPGINSGAVFFPDGKSIALTLSHQGNSEIYQMDLATKSVRRITKSFSPDVDPSINNAGSLMTFLSGRAGKPMIYTLDPRGMEQKVKRISFIGQYNATPRFSPDGTEIAFSSWLDNRFDIFRIDADGNNLYRLTKDFGSNEDPTYSNDGQFIAFSSQRVISRKKAVQNIYIMDREGKILGQVTKGLGNCITPRWSKSL